MTCCTCEKCLEITCYVLNTVLLVFWFVIFFYFADNLEFDSEISSAISNELKNNFYSVPIADFNQENSLLYYDNSLRNLKETLSLSYINFGTWQGTLKGCGKTKTDNTTSVKLLEDGKSCDSEEEFLESIEPAYISSYNGIKLSKTTIGQNYYQLLNNEGSVVFENEECPKGKKSCGYIDTYKNKLCVDNEDNCPINYIKIDKNKPKDVNITKTIIGNNGKNMYISNNPYSDNKTIPYIVGTFKIADEKICSIPSLYWSKSDLFALDGNIKKYANKCILNNYNQHYAYENELRYHKLDDIKIRDLYEENHILDYIKRSNLEKYGYNLDKYFRDDKYLYLYVRSFIGFNKTCLKERKKQFDIDQLYELEKKHTISDRMLSWSGWIKGLITLSEIGNIVSLVNLKDSSWIKIIIQDFILFGASLANMIYASLANDYDDAYEEEFKCSDVITNELYNIMTKKIKDCGDNIFLTSIFIIICFAISLVLLVCHIIKKCKYPNNQAI